MDPKTNLEEQLAAARRILELRSRLPEPRDDGASDDDAVLYDELNEAISEEADILAERVLALHAWRESGGFDPYVGSIYDLTHAVRHHPDYAFGTVFTREDFPDGIVPDDFNGKVVEDLMTQRGSEYIYDHYGPVDDD